MRKPKEKHLRGTVSDKPAAEPAQMHRNMVLPGPGPSANTQGCAPISSSSGSQPGGEYPGHRIILPLSCEPLEQRGGLQGIVID